MFLNKMETMDIAYKLFEVIGSTPKAFKQIKLDSERKHFVSWKIPTDDKRCQELFDRLTVVREAKIFDAYVFKDPLDEEHEYFARFNDNDFIIFVKNLEDNRDGPTIQEYHPNPKYHTISLSNWKQGKWDGVWKTWNMDGKLLVETFMENGEEMRVVKNE